MLQTSLGGPETQRDCDKRLTASQGPNLTVQLTAVCVCVPRVLGVRCSANSIF